MIAVGQLPPIGQLTPDPENCHVEKFPLFKYLVEMQFILGKEFNSYKTS